MMNAFDELHFDERYKRSVVLGRLEQKTINVMYLLQDGYDVATIARLLHCEEGFVREVELNIEKVATDRRGEKD